MSRSFAVSAFMVAGTLALGAAGLFAFPSSSQAAAGLFQCDGSRPDVIDCCERSIKPVWWKQSGSSCGSAVRCFRVKDKRPSLSSVNAGSTRIICRIVKIDRENQKHRSNDGKRGGGQNHGRGSSGQSANSSAPR